MAHKVELTASHGMVQIHHHSILLHFQNHTIKALPLAVLQRQYRIGHYMLAVELTVDQETILRQLDDVIVAIGAVSLIHTEGKIKGIATRGEY